MINQAEPTPNKNIIDAINRVIESKVFVKGQEAINLEKEFSEITGTNFNLTVNSGTSALFLILKALNFDKNSEVIVPANSFLASANTVELAGYNTQFADVDKSTFNLDPDNVKKQINKNTKAIMAVHLYGKPAPMDELKEISNDYNLVLIEDAAQAHGAKYKGSKIGSIGYASAFSFFPTKNMTVFGDGGMISTIDRHFYNNLRMLRNAGRKDQADDAEIFGFNFRLSEILASIGREDLINLNHNNNQRIKIAKIYSNEIENPNIFLPKTNNDEVHVFHQYNILVPNKRDKLKNFLYKNHIQSSIKYSIPLHLVTAFKKKYNFQIGSFPNSEYLTNCQLSLPMHPFLDENSIEHIIHTLNKFN